MAPAASPNQTLHELSKWLVVIGLALICATAAVHLAERSAERRYDTLVERSARYRQTEYASRYESHAQRAEERLAQIKSLGRIFGNPLPGGVMLVLSSMLFGLTSAGPRKVQRVKSRKPPKGQPKSGRPRSRPAGTRSQKRRSAPPHTPRQNRPGPGSG